MIHITKEKVCLIVPPDTFLLDPLMCPPLGPLYVAAILEQEGHDVLFLDLRVTSQIEKVTFPQVKYYGLTATTADFNSVVEIKNLIKAQNPQSIVILGGVHATVKPEESAKEFDAVVVGEGEKSIFKILHGARGIVTSDVIENIDTIPYPARHLLEPNARFSRRLYEGQKHAETEIATSITSSRGCPFNCSFCASPGMWNRKVRFRSPENFVDEVKYLIDAYGCTHFRVSDDNFSLNKERTLEISRLLEPLNIRFRCHTRVSLVDEEILSALEAAGCNEITFGIETTDDYILEKLQKGETVESQEHALRLTKDAGISVGIYLMAGLPFETWDTIHHLKEFITRNKKYIDRYVLSTLAPYPGSDIYNNPEKYDIVWMEKNYDKLLLYNDKVLIATVDCTQKELTEHRNELSTFLKKVWSE